jgi:hypothetical protein
LKLRLRDKDMHYRAWGSAWGCLVVFWLVVLGPVWGKRVSRGACVCVFSFGPFGRFGVANFLCVVLSCRGLCAKHR